MVPNPDRHITGNYGEDLSSDGDEWSTEDLAVLTSWPDEDLAALLRDYVRPHNRNVVEGRRLA